MSRAGCRVVRAARDGRPLEFDCPDVESKVRLLSLSAIWDARYDRRVRALAVGLVRGLPDLRPALIARVLQQAVKRRVRYLGEGIETFQSSFDTWRLGVGDCDDSARLLVALALSVGLEARIVALRNRRGVPVHACAVLDGRWAETTLDAALGEHPLEAFARLKRSGRPTRNYDGQTELAAVDDEPSTPQLTREILAAAWPTVPGLPPVSPAALQMVQAIANFEGGAGVGCWSRCPGVCHNWGALQHPGSPVTHDGSTPDCPPGSAPCTDSHPNADGTSTPYGVCFETYPDRQAGAADYLRVLLIRHGGAAKVGSGDAYAMAEVMYRNRYFGGFGATPEERIGHYADAIATQAASIAPALGEPVMVERGPKGGAALSLGPVDIGTGLAVAGLTLVAWAALKRKRKKG